MDEHPGIGFADGPGGRRAIVLGTGLDAWEVVATVRANRGSADAAAAYLELPRNLVRAAVRYHADYPEDIDDRIGRQAAIAAREEAAAERARAMDDQERGRTKAERRRRRAAPG